MDVVVVSAIVVVDVVVGSAIVVVVEVGVGAGAQTRLVVFTVI